jgi:hypothetical protein
MFTLEYNVLLCIHTLDLGLESLFLAGNILSIQHRIVVIVGVDGCEL